MKRCSGVKPAGACGVEVERLKAGTPDLGRLGQSELVGGLPGVR